MAASKVLLDGERFENVAVDRGKVVEEIEEPAFVEVEAIWYEAKEAKSRRGKGGRR